MMLEVISTIGTALMMELTHADVEHCRARAINGVPPHDRFKLTDDGYQPCCECWWPSPAIIGLHLLFHRHEDAFLGPINQGSNDKAAVGNRRRVFFKEKDQPKLVSLFAVVVANR
jgi:hypothetical protein